MKSLTDRHAELTIVGDMTDQAELLEDPARKGAVMTLSVAAHHRQLHSRLRVDAEEAAAWITVILGDEWAGSVYAAGALSTVSAGLRPALTTQFFYVFVGPDGKPEPAPESFNLALQPLR
ncbi:hypothetical protein [Microbacterium sp.]|uniref:hypothetical protein n=1 Tax=Microbacterium sp. TaxID=51671 RepID=UPI003A9135F9